MVDTAVSRNIESTKSRSTPLRLFPVEKLNIPLYNMLIRKIELNGGEIAVGTQKSSTKDRESLTKASILPILDKLRLSSMSTSNKLFDEIAEEVWGELGLNGSSNPVLIENLLIKAVEDIYNEQSVAQAVGKKDPKREAAINRDISLLMFGLLDGYYHTKISQGIKEPVESSIRYKQYLNANVYVELEYHGEGTYAEIVAKEQIERPNKQPRPLNRITGIASKCKEKIGGKLFDLIKAGDYQNYSQEAVFSEETGQRNDLPRPYFTLEKYTPRTAAGKMILPAPEPQPEPAPQPPQMPSSEPESQLPRLPDDDISNIEYLIHLISENYWKILIVFLALALCIGVIVFILGGNYSHTTTRRERPAGFQEDPQRTEQEWLEEYRYVGPLAKEHVG